MMHLSIYGQNLLTDIRPGLDGSEINTNNHIIISNKTYFIGNNSATETNIYETDGTAAGTIRIVGEVENIQPFYLMGEIDNSIIFLAFDETFNSKIYKTNRSVGNITLIGDLNPNPIDIDVLAVLKKFNNEIYFAGANPDDGIELYKTDGSNITYIKDINPGSENSFFSLTNIDSEIYDGYLYFPAGTAANGMELWRTDGTEAGTTLVKDINTDNSSGSYFLGSGVTNFEVFNGELYFSAYENVYGRELYKTNGTSLGTLIVKDLASGDGNPEELIVYNGNLYFIGNTNSNYKVLYKSNGSAVGTNSFFEANSSYANTHSIVNFNTKLYFVADAISDNATIYNTDGITTVSCIDPNPSGINNNINNFTLINNNLFYSYSDELSISQIYRSFGNTWNTQKMTNFNSVVPGINEFEDIIPAGDCALFIADNGTGDEPHVVCNEIGSTIGFEEIITQIRLFPNPVIDYCYIDFGEMLSGSYTIFNQFGQVVTPLTYFNNTNIQINCSSFTEGMYYVEMNTSKFSKKYKLIK